ncbi:Uncharacterized protein APZ42_020624 [Daphnia magna]|uniref:Uncharacterized protein n=1 Tax=Daphnia magna TaxID=35525 RepID=A0A164X9M5_9CRUS|nr:Uncharacterized protein APZ42_020624 [Daphnia magna]
MRHKRRAPSAPSSAMMNALRWMEKRLAKMLVRFCWLACLEEKDATHSFGRPFLRLRS